MLRVFAQLCVDYVQGSDIEISEALAAQVAKYQKGFDRLAEEPEVKGNWDPVSTNSAENLACMSENQGFMTSQ